MKQITTLPELKATYHAARRAMLRRCNSAGMTQAEAARELGATPQDIARLVKQYGIEWIVILQGPRKNQ